MRELEHSLRHHSDRVAAVAAAARMTYGELEARSRRLVSRIAQLRLHDDALLVIHAGRTVELIVGIVAALRAGRPYTIIEPGEIADRQIRQLAQLGPLLVLSDQSGPELPAAPSLALQLSAQTDDAFSDTLAVKEARGDAAAYILFTSGSTGAPKGVIVTQANLRHYTAGIRNKLAVPHGLRYAHVSTFAADLGNTSLFLSLLTGGALHVVPSDCRKDPFVLAEYLAAERIQFLKLTPSHWNLLMQLPPEARRFRLDYLVLGGEPLTPSLATASLRSRLAERVVNHYGPTETTIGVLAHILDDNDVFDNGAASVPIGTPFGDTRILIEGEDGVRRNGLATGELLIGGPSVAAGYYKDPEATAQKFLTDLSPHPETRFYRSGDVVSSDEQGRVTFIGRRDRQIKVRGYRVELDHVEAALRQLAGIRDARIRAGTGLHAHQLTALLVPEEPDSCTHEFAIRSDRPREAKQEERRRILTALRQTLPDYMIPQHYFFITRFPINANGKTDGAIVDSLLAEAFAMRSAAAVESDEPHTQTNATKDLLAQIKEIWRGRLLVREVASTDDFFGLGGNSVDAILVVSDLQRRGYSVSANQFFARPTPAALTDLIQKSARCADSEGPVPSLNSDVLGPAQRWFFRQQFRDPGYWNQALLFECSVELSAATLSAALHKLCRLHPMLETRYFTGRDGWHAEHVRNAAADCLTHGTLPVGELSDAQAAIAKEADRMHRSIDIERGKVFKVHLLKRVAQRDCVLFIAHHLCVDAVSWRILLEDLVHLYTAQIEARNVELPPAKRSYWDWVHHLAAHRERLLRQASYWDRVTAAALRDRLAPTVRTAKEDNSERESQTVWFALNAQELQRVSSAVATHFACGPSTALLGVFLDAYARTHGPMKQWVEVESHGRQAHDDFDVSRTVGWFTSAFPVLIDCRHETVEGTIRATHEALSGVPDLGTGYLPWVEELATRQTTSVHFLYERLRPSICFNYLGDMAPVGTGALTLIPSDVPMLPARGPTNSRVHDLKLTARCIGGELIVDIGFSRRRFGAVAIRDLACQVRDRLVAIAGGQPPTSHTPFLQDGSSTGLLCSVPRQSFPESRGGVSRNNYRKILLTGATGFIGCHLLKALLTLTEAEIVCPVRRNSSASATARLRALFSDYFGRECTAEFDSRCCVVEAASLQSNCGLEGGQYRDLSYSCDAIFHFAADTRLFAHPAEVTEANVEGTRAAISFAQTGRPKHLHYMSTLAVAGINPRPTMALFPEQALDIGQEFQNAYELSKYRSEELVRAHISRGGQAYIYRAGNVSGDSQTGRFSRAGANNRIIQILRGIAETGYAPVDTSEEIALTPVDDVVNACLILASDPIAIGGVYHLDNGKCVRWSDVFSILQQEGLVLEPSPQTSLRAFFSEPYLVETPAVAMARLWVNRPDRNLQFDARATQARLSREGFVYHEIDTRWLTLLVRELLSRGLLDGVAGSKPWASGRLSALLNG